MKPIVTKNKKILVLADAHAPYTDMQVIKQAYEFNKTFKADIVIQLGDLLDQKAWSKYVKDPEDDSPALELKKSIAQCLEIAKYFPNMHILNSNHDVRYVKRALEIGIPKPMIRSLEELIPVPGWKWHLDAEPLVVDGIAFMHGDELNGAPIHKAQKLGRPVVHGHTHQSSLEYMQTFEKNIWAMEAGCVINKKSRAFDYAASSLTKVWVGFAYIDNGVPHLVPKKR